MRHKTTGLCYFGYNGKYTSNFKICFQTMASLAEVGTFVLMIGIPALVRHRTLIVFVSSDDEIHS